MLAPEMQRLKDLASTKSLCGKIPSSMLGATRLRRGAGARYLGLPYLSTALGRSTSYISWTRLQGSVPWQVLEICPRGNNKLVIIIFPCS